MLRASPPNLPLVKINAVLGQRTISLRSVIPMARGLRRSLSHSHEAVIVTDLFLGPVQGRGVRNGFLLIRRTIFSGLISKKSFSARTGAAALRRGLSLSLRFQISIFSPREIPGARPPVTASSVRGALTDTLPPWRVFPLGRLHQSPALFHPLATSLCGLHAESAGRLSPRNSHSSH
jgi:hypothetical protein